MPLSSFTTVAKIMDQLWRQEAKTILDLGLGYGIYGSCIRNWLDEGVLPYKKIIHGVEGFKKYKSPSWAEYDEIYEGLIQDYKPEIKYDAILFLDVLEHFNLGPGVEILAKIKTWLAPGGILLVSTPAIFCKQGAVNGNDLETHRSLWQPEDLPEYEILTDGRPGDEYGHLIHLLKYTNKKETGS